MKEFEPDAQHFKSEKRGAVIHASLAWLGFLPMLAAFVHSFQNSNERVYSGFWFFVASVGAVAAIFAIREARLSFRSRARILLTENTMVIKRRRQPARYLNRGDCVAFKPLTNMMVRQDGSEYAFGMPGMPVALSRDVATFVFSHWWSVETFEAIHEDFEARLPRCHQTARWYTLAIVLTVAAALVLLAWMPGYIAFPGPLAAIALLIVLRSPHAARRRARDRERRECEYALVPEEGDSYSAYGSDGVLRDEAGDGAAIA